jgi:hypothetical protein
VTTARQPLTLADGGANAAAHLTAGDAILRRQDGKGITAKVRRLKPLPDPARVFNLVLEPRGTCLANGCLARSKPAAE